MKNSLAILVAISVHFNVQSQDYLWAKIFGSEGFDRGAEVKIDANGNVYSVGTFSGTVDFDPGTGTESRTSAGDEDAYVLKLDSEGNFVWALTMGAHNSDSGSSIAIDRDGNVIVAGNFETGMNFGSIAVGGYDDAFISKIDPNGNFVWAKSVGGNYGDYAMSVAVDGGGDVYLTGQFENGGDFDPGEGTHYLYSPGGFNLYILKLSQAGEFIWATSIGESNNVGGRSITVDQAGDILVAGVFTGNVDFDPSPATFVWMSDGGYDVFILKLNSAGEFVWAKRAGGPGAEGSTSISVDASGNIYSTGTYEGIADFDPSQETHSLTTSGLMDIFILKWSAGGEYVWAKSVGGSNLDRSGSINADHEGDIVVTGTFTSVADLNPGTSTEMVPATGDFDAFVLKLNSSGDFEGYSKIGGTSLDYAFAAIDAAGNIYVTGYFGSQITFQSGGQIIQRTAQGTTDIFVSKLHSLVTGISEYETVSIEVNAHPNPVRDLLMVDGSGLLVGLRYVLLDQYGRRELEGQLEKGVTSIDTRNIPQGLHILRIESPNLKPVKLIKVY